MPNWKRLAILAILVFFPLILNIIYAQDRAIPELRAADGQTQDGQTEYGLVITNLSVEDKRSIRRRMMDQFLQSYTDSQTFDRINQYMIAEYRKTNNSRIPKYPDILIKEAFEKSNNLIVQTKKFFGNSFTRVYDPDLVEKKAHKFLWLKGLYFLILGINDEHRLAVSYFYLPGNESLKRDFLKKVVLFSYPEIPDVEENKVWREKMLAVMERLGYDVFNLKKFGISCPDLTQTAR